MKRRLDILFLAIALIHLAPLWIFPLFPTQDGPAHLETAYFLANYHNAGLEKIHEYIALQPTWSPNTLTQFLLAGLIFLLNPITAEKVLLSIFVLAFPFSFKYWMRRVVGRPHAAEFFIFPFIYNYFLYKEWRRYGPYFILSLALFVVYLCAPSMILSASVLHQRAALFPYFAVIIWFGNVKLKRPASALIILLSLASSLAYFSARYPIYEKLNNQYREVTRLSEKIKNHTTVLPLILSPHIQYDKTGRSITPFSKMIDVFKHVAAYLTLDKDIIEFTFYIANQPHFPLQSMTAACYYTAAKGWARVDDPGPPVIEVV